MADSLNKGGTAEEKSSARAAALTVGDAESFAERGAPAGRVSEASDLAGCSSAGASVSSPVAEPKRAFSAKAKAGIAALAFVALVCFGVSAVAFTGGFGVAGGQGPTTDAAASEELQDQVAGASASSADAPAGADAEASSADGAAASDAASNAGSASASSGAASSGGAVAGGGSSAASGSTSGASGSSGSDATGSGSGSGSDSSQAPSNLITVHVSISSSSVGNPVSGGGTFSFKKGATVYDALCACGLSVNASNTGYGVYVAAIGGLAEKEHGAGSGWMYSVNGTTPMTSCSNYRLSDGDSVSWFYSVD